MITYAWREPFGNAEVNTLHAEGFNHEVDDDDWWSQVNQYSLGWACARDRRSLVGFVNVAWNGASHAFILDTVVAVTAQHQGIGTSLVALAADEARNAGCSWLHVDFEDHLRAFYFSGCGFTPTNAGLIALAPTPWDCGSKGVSGPITLGPRAWRERCRDDRDTGRRDQQEGRADC